MENYKNEITELIVKNVIRDIQIRMLMQEKNGFIVDKIIMDGILSEVETNYCKK